jgi:hypothetical protein
VGGGDHEVHEGANLYSTDSWRANSGGFVHRAGAGGLHKHVSWIRLSTLLRAGKPSWKENLLTLLLRTSSTRTEWPRNTWQMGNEARLSFISSGYSLLGLRLSNVVLDGPSSFPKSVGSYQSHHGTQESCWINVMWVISHLRLTTWPSLCLPEGAATKSVAVSLSPLSRQSREVLKVGTTPRLARPPVSSARAHRPTQE